MQHMVLVGFNEAMTDKRHEAGEVTDLSHIPDLADLIANRTVMEFVQIDPPVDETPILQIVEPKGRVK